MSLFYWIWNRKIWIEGLRTDQLKLFGTQIAVSQLLSAVLIVSALVVLIVNFWKKIQIQKQIHKIEKYQSNISSTKPIQSILLYF